MLTRPGIGRIRLRSTARRPQLPLFSLEGFETTTAALDEVILRVERPLSMRGFLVFAFFCLIALGVWVYLNKPVQIPFELPFDLPKFLRGWIRVKA